MSVIKLFYILFVILAIGSTIMVIITETNMFVRQKGSLVQRSIIYEHQKADSIVKMELRRNSETPSFLDAATFVNGEQIMYIYMEKNELRKIPVIFHIPRDIDGGTYRVDVSVDGELKTLAVRIK